MKNTLKIIIGLSCILLVAGCMAGQPVKPIVPVSLDATNFRPKAEQVVIIVDASESMDDLQNASAKFDIAKNIAEGLVNTIPDLEMEAGLISFGHSPAVSKKNAMEASPLARFDRKALLNGLNTLGKAGGTSPMSDAIEAASSTLENKDGRKALVIISDGEDMGSKPIAAAQRLAQSYPDKICIHTVQVGVNPKGTELLQSISKVTSCGSFGKAADLQSGQQMAAFVKSALLEAEMDADKDGVPDSKDQCPQTPTGVTVDSRGCPLDRDGDGVPDYMDSCPNTPPGVQVDTKGCPLDSDGDGVADYLDRCPGTPAGQQVDRYGCVLPTVTGAQMTTAGTLILDDVQFESGSADLKAGSRQALDKIVVMLNNRPDAKMEIQGHTDSLGNSAFNYRLSENRALAVKAYLVEKGIAQDRLTAKGYGPSKPIAGNDTAAGRAQNRRVEFRPFQ